MKKKYIFIYISCLSYQLKYGMSRMLEIKAMMNVDCKPLRNCDVAPDLGLSVCTHILLQSESSHISHGVAFLGS